MFCLPTYPTFFRALAETRVIFKALFDICELIAALFFGLNLNKTKLEVHKESV